MNKLIRKDLPALPALSTAPSGEIQALVNSTGIVDSQNDNVLPGAWRRVIASGKLPKLLISHDWDALPVGTVLRLDEWLPGDSRLPQWHQANGAGGLIMTAQANMATQAGREFFDSVAGGFVEEYSVGFIPAQGGVRYSADERHISDVELLPEVSAVLMGASPETSTLAVKRGRAYAGRPAWIWACDRELAGIVRATAAAVRAVRRAAPVTSAVMRGLPPGCRTRFAELVATTRS